MRIQTPLQRRCDDRLRDLGHESLQAFVVNHRRGERSWRWIASEIMRLTSERVTDETVRAWYKDDVQAVA